MMFAASTTRCAETTRARIFFSPRLDAIATRDARRARRVTIVIAPSDGWMPTVDDPGGVRAIGRRSSRAEASTMTRATRDGENIFLCAVARMYPRRERSTDDACACFRDDAAPPPRPSPPGRACATVRASTRARDSTAMRRAREGGHVYDETYRRGVGGARAMDGAGCRDDGDEEKADSFSPRG